MNRQNGHKPVSGDGVALFVDLENLISGASTMGLPLDLDPILEKITQFGKIRLRRAYGDIYKTLQSVGREHEINSVRMMLQRNLIQIEDIPFVAAKKNAADIRLAVEALSSAYNHEWIQYFAIVGSDKDYIPLYNKLRELDRTIIVVALERQTVNPVLVKAADKVFYYEDLFESEDEEVLEDAPKKGMTGSEMETFKLLFKSIRFLEGVGRKPLGASVLAKMQEIQSDFDLYDSGYGSFKDLANAARKAGIVQISEPQTGEGDIVLSLNMSAPKKHKMALAESSNGTTATKAKKYRSVLETQVLKLMLPDFQTRQICYNALDASYSILIKNGSFALTEWVSTAENEIAKSTGKPLPQQVLYKIALSLFFARCLFIGDASDRANPIITGLSIHKDQWEERIVSNLLNQLQQRVYEREMDRDALAYVFYGDADSNSMNRISDALALSITR